MRLDIAGTRFQADLRTDVGKHFSGLVIESALVRDRGGVNDYLLRVSKNSVAIAGDVVFYDDDKYILGLAATEMSREILFRFMRMIQVTHELEWKRIIVVADLVSGLERESGEAPLGTIPISLIVDGKIDDVFRVDGSRYRLITGAAVRVNDRVGTYIITLVEPRSGLYFCEAR